MYTSEPIKYVNDMGNVMWQPAITGWAELRYGINGERWTNDRSCGEPALYFTHWGARRCGARKARAKGMSNWQRVE